MSANQTRENPSGSSSAGADTSEDGGGSFGSLLVRFGVRDVPAWAISLSVHVLVMLCFAGIKYTADNQQESSIISTLEEFEKQMAFDTTATDQVGTNADVTSLVPVGGSTALQQGDNPQTKVETQLSEEIKVEVPVTEEKLQVATAEMLATVETKGESTVNTPGGVEGAIDRLAMELMMSLRERKTLAIWLFDASLSLEKRRNTIADRFENVYKQLDALDADKAQALTTAVATYGEKWNIITKDPVSDVRTVIPKVRSIPNDVSGKEMVFTAVGAVANAFKKYRLPSQGSRNVLVFIVTDEKGDDAGPKGEIMEEVINVCRRSGIKVYVVGNGALFGREKGSVAYTYPDGDKATINVEVDQGPESIAPEALNLAFWGNRGPALDKMSSGYGPYALTRLCKETGGLYFIADEGGVTTIRFNPAVMRNYSPDYISIADYEKGVLKNKAKYALVMAATKTKLDEIKIPSLLFEATSDNVLRTEITEAQKPAAAMDYRINEMITLLTQGEKDRDKITEPRWRAAYDLAMGRALAMHVRVLGYNKLLAEMKGLPKAFTKKGSNEWRLEPSKNILSGADVKKFEQQATKYLKRVIDEHPETPWATLAEREYSQPMGWDWKESTGNYPLAGLTPEEKKKRIQLADDERKKKAAKTPAAPPRPVPKL